MTKLYDRAEALERLGDDEEIFSEIASLFVAEHASYCSTLEAALAAADIGVLRREAHTVKSMLATFSYESGRELAMQLENLAASGRLDGAVQLTSDVVDAVKRLAKALEEDMV